MSAERKVDVEALRGHTPGPWAERDGAIYGVETRATHGGRTCEEVGHDPHDCGPLVFATVDQSLLADIKRGFWDDVEDTAKVDLALCAAAPDLFAEVIERRARDAAVAELIDAVDRGISVPSYSEHGDALLFKGEDAAALRAALAAVRGGA